jgi:hypothetical protein
MTSRFDVLTQQLLQKNIADCSVEELQELASAHPYFAPAQYALLLKLKEEDYSSYEKQFQKAILYYHDPLTFDQFINEERYGVAETDFIVKEVTTPPGEENTETIDAETSETLEEIQTEFVETIQPQEETHIIDTSPLETIIENKEEEPIVETSPEINVEDGSEENVLSQETKETIETEPRASAPIDELAKIEIKKDPEPVDNVLAFEPYHTVDYFASQGIKLSQEEATKDKFGKQLKSFTEWLKTMKKHPVKEQVKPLDNVAEQKVESLAAHSVEAEDVYTETMAEVWIRQGNREKAIEIYNKLSLLNPSKKAYFAAKINSLS